jgi:hypothetical protein
MTRRETVDLIQIYRAIGDLQGSVGELKGQVGTFIEQMAKHDDRTTDLESRTRKVENRQHWYAGAGAAVGGFVSAVVAAVVHMRSS